MDNLEIRPISIAKANAYVEKFHRHHRAKVGCRFAISVYRGDELHGVAICSNPVARNADDGMTLEISRLCTDGERNACSKLYGACARIAKEMGFKKIQTYILESENGASLRASGYKLEKDNAGSLAWKGQNNKRQIDRDKKPVQMSLFEEKTVPEEMKKRYARAL